MKPHALALALCFSACLLITGFAAIGCDKGSGGDTLRAFPDGASGDAADGSGLDLRGPGAGEFDGSSVALGDRYLFYYENGGLAYASTKPVCDSGYSYGAWTQLLSPIPLDIATSWPASLAPYRVVAIPWLGSAPGSHGLNATQQQQLSDWLHAGGTAFFITDFSYDAASSNANNVLNALLASLGVSASIDGADKYPYYYSLSLDPKSPIGAGVQPLGCGAGTYVTVSPPAVAVGVAGGIVLAMQPLGSGRVVVLSDATCVSDYTNAWGTPPLFEDCAINSGAGAALGALLKRLGGH